MDSWETELPEEVLAFCGDFSKLEQRQEIEQFLGKYHIRPISLCSGPIVDIGGIIAVAQTD